jgi:aminoglycoside 6'-N-acetyltransferase
VPEVRFRPLRESDLPLLHEWLQREHVRRWWRDSRTLDETVAHYLPSIRGEEPTDHYLIVIDGREVGMIETYLVSDHPEWEAIVEVGQGVAGVDLLIGEEDLVGRGLGPAVLRAFAREHVRAPVLVAAVDEENRRSWRAFEKAGFVYARDVEEEGRPHRLMRLEPTEPTAEIGAGS